MVDFNDELDNMNDTGEDKAKDMIDWNHDNQQEDQDRRDDNQ